MNYLEKVILFHEDKVFTVMEEETGKIYIAIRKICENLRMSESQSKNQVTKIQNDELLIRGFKKLSLKVQTQVRELSFIELDYFPAWLFKISLSRFDENLKEKLMDYQLYCKDILAAEFLGKRQKESIEEPKYGTDINEIEAREKMIREDTDTIRNLMLRIAYNYKRIGQRSKTGFGKIKESYKNLKRTGFIDRDSTLNIEEIDRKNEFSKKMLLEELEEDSDLRI